MAKVSVTKDSRTKADVIVDANTGTITFTKDTKVRVDGDDDNLCKAAKIVLMKIKAGGKDGDKKN